MPVITELKVQARNQSRYNVYVDGKYQLAVSANTVLVEGLHVGQEVSESELAAIELRAQTGNAYDKALSYLDLRRRSKQEVRDYLRRKAYEPTVIAAVVERLEHAGLLDDRAFAAAWVRDRLQLKPRSKRALVAELRAKGVASESIQEVISELVDETSEEAQLRQVMERKWQQARYREDPQKLVAAVVRQGYAYTAAKTIIAELQTQQ